MSSRASKKLPGRDVFDAKPEKTAQSQQAEAARDAQQRQEIERRINRLDQKITDDEGQRVRLQQELTNLEAGRHNN